MIANAATKDKLTAGEIIFIQLCRCFGCFLNLQFNFSQAAYLPFGRSGDTLMANVQRTPDPPEFLQAANPKAINGTNTTSVRQQRFSCLPRYRLL